MKKILFLGLILMAGMLSATQDLTLISPNGGEAWLQGSSQTIKWASMLTSGTLKITLWRGDDNVGVIAKGLAATQESFLWTVGELLNGGKAPVGPGYTVKIRLQGGTPNDVSNASFSITRLVLKPAKKLRKVGLLKANPGLLTPAIQVWNPKENGKYPVGTAVPIQWKKETVGADKVNIHLFSESGTTPEEVISAGHANTGMAQWTAASRYAWPGKNLYVKITSDDGKASGKSGLFSVYVRPPQKKVVAVTGKITNRETHTINAYPQAECLSAQLPMPGRAPQPNEIKAGHYYQGGKQGKCYWSVKYHFHGDVAFDLGAVKGKAIQRAELLLSFSDEATQGPTGTLATNEFCNSQSRIMRGDTYVLDFSMYSPGEKKKIDLLDQVSQWAATAGDGGKDFIITIKGKVDLIDNVNSICLKYYSGPILFVEYVE